ncbi:Mss4-like protein, partial [Gorgonomyces haynaldii]
MQSLDAVRQQVEQLDKNAHRLYCLRCDCLVLKTNVASLAQHELQLPQITKADSKTPFYWKVNDMMAFENIGFSRPADGLKYLLCADCDLGPLGFQQPDG